MACARAAACTSEAPSLSIGGHPLLDEGHVPPAVGPEGQRVVIGLAAEAVGIGGNVVPLLAGHLAGLAADADRGVGEEALAGLGLRAVGGGPLVDGQLHGLIPARAPVGLDQSGAPGPRGRRPGRMSQVVTLYSLM